MTDHNQISATTILCVRRDGVVALGGDGQATMGATIMKSNVRKVRRLYNSKVLAGFAGGSADAFTLFERFERQLEKYHGQLTRAAVELAKDWRSDRALRRLEATLVVADKEQSLLVSGSGDVIEPEKNILAIGSGGAYARAAAIALSEHSSMAAEDIVRSALQIAAEICIYTNEQIIVDKIEESHDQPK